MAPKNEADDVLDFINSLPDSKLGTPKPQGASAESKENKEDFLEFLDELAAHEKKPSGAKSKGFEPKTKNSTSSTIVEPESANVSAHETKTEGSGTTQEVLTPSGSEDDENALEIDPIGSISNWWSKEGSNTVSSLWGSIASNAQQITDQTYQLASSTSNQLSQQRHKLLSDNGDNLAQLDALGNRLNSVLTTVSQQIAQGLIGPDDELLNILLIHDLDNVPYLDKECSSKFNKVMNQVEGGIRTSVTNVNHRQSGNELASFDKVHLNLFYGKIIDGEKLCFANLDSCIKEFNKTIKKHEVEKKEEKEKEEENEKDAENDEGARQDEAASVEVNQSNVFISIQAITSRSSNESVGGETESDSAILIDSNNHDSFSFTLILKDITNGITIVTKTQPFPLVWSQWLGGESKLEDDAVNPAEWVKEWIKDGLGLSFGVLAQQYVIKRMGF